MATTKKGLCFDPRTKLAVVIVMSIITMGGYYQSGFHYLPAVLPLVLFISSKQWLSSLRYAGCFGLCWGMQALVLPKVSGAGGFLLAAFCMLPLYFLPTIGAAQYLIRTTTAGEFVAAMEKMHIPNGFTISVAVIFRFFPTLLEEWRAISDAMKMRGVGLFKKKAGKYLEYKLVPMLMCSISIGDELSAAALTRGLDSECGRTSIHRVRLCRQDTALLLACLGILLMQMIFWVGGCL